MRNLNFEQAEILNGNFLGSLDVAVLASFGRGKVRPRRICNRPGAGCDADVYCGFHPIDNECRFDSSSGVNMRV